MQKHTTHYSINVKLCSCFGNSVAISQMIKYGLHMSNNSNLDITAREMKHMPTQKTKATQNPIESQEKKKKRRNNPNVQINKTCSSQ